MRPVKIRYYIAAMQERGFDAESTLRGSGINPDRLNDPSYLIDRSQYQIVVSNMIRLAGDQSIGLDVGSRVQLCDFGILAHALITARDIGSSTAYWLKYSEMIGSFLNAQIVEEGNQWTTVFTPSQQMGFLYNFLVEEMLVSGIKIVETLTSQPVVIKNIELGYPAPLHTEIYRSYFDCPVEFNSHRNAIAIISPSIDYKFPTNDDELNAICVQHCSKVMQHVGKNSSLIAELRQIFLKNPRMIPTLTEAAALMGLNPRTLRRYLNNEGETYKRLVGQFRLDMTTEYLETEQFNQDEISELLGYSDANAFRRAFKSWTGQTVGRYTEKLKIKTKNL